MKKKKILNEASGSLSLRQRIDWIWLSYPMLKTLNRLRQIFSPGQTDSGNRDLKEYSPISGCD